MTAGCARTRRKAHAFIERLLTRVPKKACDEVVCQGLMASVNDSFSRNANATVRAICATSMECVIRVRNRSPS